jgi:archaemetzincin
VSFFYLATVGAVEPEILVAVESCLQSNFGFATRKIEPFAEPEYAFDAQRGQYSSVLILRDLVARCPPDGARLLALTEKDLFIPMLSFIYGQAQLGGSVAMVSLARLRQEFYGLPANRTVLLARTRKEVLHEVGHTFSLTHCDDRSCTMCLSTNIRQLDLKSGRFCDACTVLLHESMDTMNAEKSK